MHTSELIELLTQRGLTVAVAESLTGGELCAELTSTPGASKVIRGSVTAYATQLKHSVLGVDDDLLSAQGAVDSDVAAQMARGVADVLGADIGLSTTGVAGPDSQDGHPVGTVYIACFHEGEVTTQALHLSGNRAQIREATVREACQLLFDTLSR
jgi:nicotinamide-nucleotide amidase